MKVISLEVENVKRVSAAFIEPNSALTCIGGKNAQGKSSVLDSIVFALAGGKKIDAKPLRDGESKGKIVLDLGEYLVTRRFTEKGTSLKVQGKEDEEGTRPVYSSGQKLLDKFFNDFSFDPVSFVGLKPKAQLEQVKALVGLDFSDLDEKRKAYFDERTEVGRQGKKVAGQLESLYFSDSAPEKEVSSSEIFKRLQTANDHNRKCDQAESALLDWHKLEAHEKENVERLREQLKEAEEKLKKSSESKKAAEKALEKLEKVDVSPIELELSNVDSVNAKVRQNQQYKTVEAEKEKLTGQYQDLTDKIKAIDEAKAKSMAEAKFPVSGLAFDETGLTFNGLPFEQASSAEQLRVSVAMGFAANPKLKLLLIKDGSLLDENSLDLVRELAEKEDAQVIMERVGHGEECTFIIEDGKILE